MEEIIFNANIINLNRFLSENSNKKYENIFSKMSYYGMDIAMVGGPLLTYLFQVFKFCKTKSSKGFSKYTCLFLFLGNIFRVFFWYGARFKNALLYQSIAVVLFQIILIHLCIKYQEDSNYQKVYLPEIKNTSDKSNIETKNNINILKNFIFAYFSKTYKSNYMKFLNPKLFWKWNEEIEFYKFIFFFTAMFATLSYFLKKVKLFFQIIGTLSAIFETFICIPQVVSNCRTKVTKNISFMMVFCWFLGDCFRLFYNIKFNAPLQLIIGLSIQVLLDFFVLLQLIFYRNNEFQESTKNTNKKQIEEINQLMKSIDELNTGK